jgi:ADP-ribose pyrophosphatase
VTSERDSELIERLVDRQVLHSGNYATFVKDTVTDFDGQQHSRDVVLHPGAVTVVALLDDGRVLLVRQYRHPAGEVLLELPAGTLDRQADGSTEDPLAAAQRELMEETGYSAARWRKVAEFFTAPGFATELMHLYLATGLTKNPEYRGPEPDEHLRLEVLPFDQVLASAERAEIRDAKTLVGIYAAAALARGGEITELADWWEATDATAS